MLKEERDRAITRLVGEDREKLRRVVAAIKQTRGNSPDASASGITARELVETWPEELAGDLREAVEAILARDETGPRVGDAAPDFSLKRLGSEERVRLSDFRGRRPVALAFGSYT